MKFVTELPQDVLTILKNEYPDKSYPAALKTFVRKYNPRNGTDNDQTNYYKKPASAQALQAK